MTGLRRFAGYLWASPNTALGLLLWPLALLPGGRAQVVDGVLELWGPPYAWFLRSFTGLAGGADAMTLGHVVLARSAEAHERTRLHERVHVWQCCALGPLFLPAYGLSSLWCLCRRRHPYLDNAFERHARRVEREQRLLPPTRAPLRS